MKNLIGQIISLIIIVVLTLSIFSSRNNITERDDVITELLGKNRKIMIEINQKTDSLNRLQQKYIRKQDSLKTYYNEKITENRKTYESKIDNIRTLSIDDGIKLLSKFLSEENSLE